METKAQLNGLRLAPRKVRAVVELVKGKSVDEAMHQLHNFIRRPAPELLKLVKSAIANAENNFHMVRGNLYIKTFFVDEGAKLKRFTPVALGRATEIQKKSSWVTLVLDEKVAGLKRNPKEKASNAENPSDIESKEHDQKKPEIKRELGEKGDSTLGNLSKKFFRRKTI